MTKGNLIDESLSLTAFASGAKLLGEQSKKGAPMTVTNEQAIQTKAYVVPKGTGPTDVWFPAGEGRRWTTKVGAEQTEGRLLQLVGSEPRGAASPLHVYRNADELYYVIDGEVTIFVGDERIEAQAGDVVLAPKGVPNAFVVRSERAEVLVTFSPAGVKGPAGVGLDGFFREIGIPVVDGEAPPQAAEPDPEEFSRKAARYGCEIVGPPPALD
jgi:mannose-6-phosphate isomerase-like protein (cupin superfamily)